MMMRGFFKAGAIAILGLVLCLGAARAEDAVAARAEDVAAVTPVHGVAMHGDPKYGPDFTHFEYVNPDAPKGGTMRLAAEGTFDSLNGFIVKGVSAPGIGNLYQTLLTKSDDEAFTEYGQIAETVEMPEDRSWVVFNLRKEAKWNDGKPLTADDVVWTFNTLVKDGAPFYHAYYATVKDVVAENAHRVKFTFSETGNRELPLILGEMVVLPRHYYEKHDFAATTLEPPLGSGPYRIKSVDAGSKIVYERVKDWWAKDLPVNKGQYNFDTLIYDMYRDPLVQLQALFAGAYDFRAENIAKSWALEYKDKVPVKEGWIKKVEIDHDLPVGMQGFVFNTRREIFKDPRVRRALNYAFDFEWSNRQLAFGAYQRTNSYFENSELAATGLPKGREAEILETYRGKVPDELFYKQYENPKTSGSGNDIRENLGNARDLLEQAGWRIGAGKVLVKGMTPFKFEILLYNDTFMRWVAPFVANLKKLGILATVRVVDTAQYQNRVDDFDFDMVIGSFGQSLSPGNEQRDYWGSDKADVKGSRNLMGVKDPVVDDLIKKVIFAKDREDLIAATKALDRVLLWSFYLIPNWHISYFRLAYWDKFGRPDVTPRYGLGIPDTWWYDDAKAAAVEAKEKQVQKK